MLFQSNKKINKIFTIFLTLLLIFNFIPLSFAANSNIPTETINETQLNEKAKEHIDELKSKSIDEQAQVLFNTLRFGEYRASSDENLKRAYIRRMSLSYSNDELNNIVKNSNLDWESALNEFRAKTESMVAQFFPHLPSVVQDALGKTEESGTVGSGQLSSGTGSYTLEGGHSMSDIYPSFIYSTTSNKFASAKDFTPDELTKYPNPSGSDGKQVYGQLLGRGGSDIPMAAGSQFASYMRTLFEYNWLQNDVVKTGGVGTLFGDTFKLIWGPVALILNFLSTGVATVFEYIDLFFDPIFDTIGDIFSSLNVVSFFQIGSKNVDHNTNTGDDSKGLLQQTIQKVFNAFGLTPRNMTLIRNLFLLVVIVIFLLLLVFVIRQGTKQRYAISKLKLYFIKGLTIILVIPVGIILKNGMDEFANALNVKGNEIRNSMIDSYVVDTLRWATTSNLSLDPIVGEGFDSRSATINESAKPTVKNIGRINEMINAFDSRVQYRDINTKIKNGSIGNSGKVVREPIMDKIGNNSLLTINNYFSRLASMGGTTNIPAAIGINSESNISVGNFQIANFHPYDKPIYPHYMFFGKQGENVVGNELDLSTLTENTKEKKSWWESIGSWISDQWSYLTGNGGNVDEETKKQIISKIELKTNDGKRSELLLPGSSKMSFVKGSWNNGYSYLYGAVNSKSVNATFGVKSNYISDPTTGPDFGQNLNPITMDNVYNYDNQSLEDVNKLISEGGEDGQKAFLQRMLDTNALTIALMNRYQGIASMPNGTKTISNQSVAFLLQTVYDGGVYKYIGQNIPTSLQSGTMNHGTQYNGFKQYVIPNTGSADYGTKFFTLSVTVIISAMVSCIAIYTLLTGPILSTIYKIFASFGKAFFTGNTAMLFTYAIYYFALRMTMIFLQMSRYAIIAIADFITNIIPGSTSIQSLGHIPVIGQFFVLVIAIIVGFVLIKPWLQIPGPNGMKDVSLVRAFLEMPLTFASIADEKITKLFNKAFGVNGSGSGKNKIGASKWAKDEFKHKTEAGKEVIKAGGKVAATTLGAGLLGGALNNKLHGKDVKSDDRAIGTSTNNEEELDANANYDKDSVDGDMSNAITSSENLGENVEEVKSIEGGNFDNASLEDDSEANAETDLEDLENEDFESSKDGETQTLEDEDEVEAETDLENSELESSEKVESELESSEEVESELESSEEVESEFDGDFDSELNNLDNYEESDLKNLEFDNQIDETDLEDEYYKSSKEVEDLEEDIETLKSKQEEELEGLENKAKEETVDNELADTTRELTPEELKLERQRKKYAKRNQAKNQAKAEFANAFKRATHFHDNKKQKEWEKEEIHADAYTDEEIERFTRKQENKARKEEMKQFEGKSKEEVRNDVNNWKKEVKDSQSKVNAKNEEFNERKKELEELIKSNDSKKANLLNEKANIKAKFDGNKAKINQEQAKINQRKERIKELKNQNSENKLDLLNKQLGELSENDNETKERLLKERKMVQAKIDSINEKIRKEEEGMKVHQNRIGILNLENSNYQKEILNYSKKAKELEQNTRLNKQKVDRLEREKDRLEKEHNQRKKELNRKITLGTRYSMSNVDKGLDYVDHKLKNHSRKKQLRDKNQLLEHYQNELSKAKINKNKKVEKALNEKIEQTEKSIKDLKNQMNYRTTRGLTTDEGDSLREKLKNTDFLPEQDKKSSRKTKNRHKSLMDRAKGNKRG